MESLEGGFQARRSTVAVETRRRGDAATHRQAAKERCAEEEEEAQRGGSPPPCASLFSDRQRFPGRMETGRQDAMSDGEGAKGSKLAARLPPPSPLPGKKKASKKKKKKKTVPGHDKHSSQVKKKSIFAIFPLDLLQRWKCEGTPQEAHTKRGPGKTTRNSLSSCSSTTSVSTPGDAILPNESLRWDGVLDDPQAEEERLCNYRLSRRKRYGEFLQQNPRLDSPFPCQQLPDLDKVAEAEKERSLHKSKSSSLMAAKNKRRPNSKQGSKTPKRQPVVLPSSKSQGVL